MIPDPRLSGIPVRQPAPFNDQALSVRLNFTRTKLSTAAKANLLGTIIAKARGGEGRSGGTWEGTETVILALKSALFRLKTRMDRPKVRHKAGAGVPTGGLYWTGGQVPVPHVIMPVQQA